MIKKLIITALISTSITAAMNDTAERETTAATENLNSRTHLDTAQKYQSPEQIAIKEIDPYIPLDADTLELFETVLSQIIEKFDISHGPEEKITIATQELIPYSNHNRPSHEFICALHPIALAICHANIPALKKLLSVIDDINATFLAVRGYRQDYLMPHLAMDPLLVFKRVPLQQRLDVIHLLGSKGADFRAIRFRENDIGCDYIFSPLFSSGNRGQLSEGCIGDGKSLTVTESNYLRACTLLYGVDPEKKDGFDLMHESYYKTAVEIFQNTESEEINTHENAKIGFKKEIERLERLAQRARASLT